MIGGKFQSKMRDVISPGEGCDIFGVAAHFDYDPEWTNQKRVFEIQPIKMIVVKMRSNTGPRET